jgi:phosphatidylethanolamine/phosphatidyl-N-methylethanolamine N-methyltransferase
MTPTNQQSGAVTRALSQNAPLRFIGAFLREPLAVGSLWPSSPSLARAVVNGCEFRPGEIVVELGPGTGAFTELLHERLDGRGQLMAVEISPAHIKLLRRRFPSCRVIHDSAENLPHYLGRRRADCIISGLAWGNMLPRVQDRIMRAIWNSMSPQGQFVAFAYAHAFLMPTSQRFRRLLYGNFARVEKTPIVWRNLPPAYIYRCWREPAKTKSQSK